MTIREKVGLTVTAGASATVIAGLAAYGPRWPLVWIAASVPAALGTGRLLGGPRNRG